MIRLPAGNFGRPGDEIPIRVSDGGIEANGDWLIHGPILVTDGETLDGQGRTTIHLCSCHDWTGRYPIEGNGVARGFTFCGADQDA